MTPDSSGASGLNFALSGEPRISNDTISFMLNRPLDVILRNMAVPLLDIGQGATYDTYGNMLPAIADHPVYIPDTTPPTLDSAAYWNETLELAFSEPLNGTTILPERMRVLDGDSGQPGISLSGIPFEVLTAIPAQPGDAPAGEPAGTALTFRMNSTIQNVIGNMTAPAVSIAEAAVHDMSGNPIQPATIPVDMSDTAPPTMDSAAYHIETGQLNVTFSEPLNHTATDHTLLELLGPSANVTLAYVGELTSVNATISATLNATHIETLGGMPSAVSARLAAVHDMSGNPIQPATIPASVLEPDTIPPPYPRRRMTQCHTR